MLEKTRRRPTGLCIESLLFSLFKKDLTNKRENSCYPGTLLHPDLNPVFFLLCADDVVLISDNVTGLQRTIDTLQE